MAQDDPRFITSQEAQARFGGGGGLLAVASVTLTNAQILTLPTVAQMVVAAQGANTIIVPISAFVLLNATAAAYTGVTNASLNLIVNGNWMSSELITQQALANGRKVLIQFVIPECQTSTAPWTAFAPDIISNALNNSDALLDQALVVKDDNQGLANYGGGDPANTMKVVVYYAVFTVA